MDVSRNETASSFCLGIPSVSHGANVLELTEAGKSDGATDSKAWLRRTRCQDNVELKHMTVVAIADRVDCLAEAENET